MKTINLWNYYPCYNHDFFIELPDEIVNEMKPYKTEEQSHWRRMRLHKVYSLDCGRYDGQVLFSAVSSCELYERKVMNQELCAMIAALPDKQAKRIYARFFLDMSASAIARAEGVNPKSVSLSIARGLRNLESVIKNLDADTRFGF